MQVGNSSNALGRLSFGRIEELKRQRPFLRFVVPPLHFFYPIYECAHCDKTGPQSCAVHSFGNLKLKFVKIHFYPVIIFQIVFNLSPKFDGNVPNVKV